MKRNFVYLLFGCISLLSVAYKGIQYPNGKWQYKVKDAPEEFKDGTLDFLDSGKTTRILVNGTLARNVKVLNDSVCFDVDFADGEARVNLGFQNSSFTGTAKYQSQVYDVDGQKLNH